MVYKGVATCYSGRPLLFSVTAWSGGRAYSFKTSNADVVGRTMEKVLAKWRERGLSVQLPLPIAEPRVYQAFRGTREVASLTITEERSE